MCGCGQPTPLANKTSTRDNTVRGKPVRYLTGHQRKRPFEDLFWGKVAIKGPNDCWIWQGPVANGRATYSIGPRRNRRSSNAGRFAWELTNGAIPKGMDVCHNCPDGDNPLCVNPAHLWLGTHSDNMRDMSKKGRAGMSGAKLSEDQVREIRIRRDQGERVKDLAAEFCVYIGTISEIVNYRTWKHI